MRFYRRRDVVLEMDELYDFISEVRAAAWLLMRSDFIDQMQLQANEPSGLPPHL